MTLQEAREQHNCTKVLLTQLREAEARERRLRRALAREHSEWLAFYDLTDGAR